MPARNPALDTPLIRATRILELLFHRVLDGMSNAEIVRSTGYPACNVCRDLAALENAGWVEKTDTERWQLTVKPVALCQAYSLSLERAASRAKNFNARVQARAEQIMD